MAQHNRHDPHKGSKGKARGMSMKGYYKALRLADRATGGSRRMRPKDVLRKGQKTPLWRRAVGKIAEMLRR